MTLLEVELETLRVMAYDLLYLQKNVLVQLSVEKIYT
jgi:hypothetical protein